MKGRVLIAAMLIGMALAVPMTRAQSSAGALGAHVVPVQGNPSCVAQCRAAHSQCRIATKGSPSCDAQLQGCLQGCLRR